MFCKAKGLFIVENSSKVKRNRGPAFHCWLSLGWYISSSSLALYLFCLASYHFGITLYPGLSCCLFVSSHRRTVRWAGDHVQPNQRSAVVQQPGRFTETGRGEAGGMSCWKLYIFTVLNKVFILGTFTCRVEMIITHHKASLINKRFLPVTDIQYDFWKQWTAKGNSKGWTFPSQIIVRNHL